LQEQVDYLNTLIENMNEMLYIYDQDLILTFMNSRGYRHMHYDPCDIIGRSILEFIPDHEREQVIREAENRLKHGQSGTYETNLIRGDGSLMPVRIKSSPLTENGKVIGGLVVAEDITEWIKVEKEMARLAQLHVVGEIAAGIGHEIRNPMTTVQGFLQLLSTNEEFAKYQSYFEVMMEELERANDIISEFLSLARDKMVNLKKSNLNNLLTSMAPLLQADALLSDKQVHLRLQDIPDVWLDVKEIRQLILNLVRNGLEAMPAGGTVTISTSQEDDKIVLSVQDEGGGIMPDVMDKIGTPFFTTKEQGKGLGLAVCYGIVSRHKAVMDILTGPQGTTFRIIFSSR
jgi:PAS domain S-box-containing protein